MYGPLLVPVVLACCFWLWRTFVPRWVNEVLGGILVLLMPLLMALDALRGSL